MAGAPFYVEMPETVNIKLTGVLSPYVSAKDVILQVLRKLTVKGAVNKILEYSGPGVKRLRTDGNRGAGRRNGGRGRS